MRFVSVFNALRVVCKPTRVNTVDGRAVMEVGFAAQFENGRFTTDDPKEIKMLRDNPGYNRDFHEVPEAAMARAAAKEAPKKTDRKKK